MLDKIGAGDQGMMFGYAVNDNEYYLPTAMVILKELSKKFNVSETTIRDVINYKTWKTDEKIC